MKYKIIRYIDIYIYIYYKEHTVDC